MSDKELAANLERQIELLKCRLDRLSAERERLVEEHLRLSVGREEDRRSALIEATLNAGTRALGVRFPTETYRLLLAQASLDQIKLVGVSFDEMGAIELLRDYVNARLCCKAVAGAKATAQQV